MDGRFRPQWAEYVLERWEQSGHSRVQFASCLGISPSYFDQFREGRVPPRRRVLKIAQSLNELPDPWLTAGLICQAGTTPGRHPCIVKETDGSLRLVRRARRKGDGLEVQPLSALGQHKFQAMAGEVVAVVMRRWNDE